MKKMIQIVLTALSVFIVSIGFSQNSNNESAKGKQKRKSGSVVLKQFQNAGRAVKQEGISPAFVPASNSGSKSTEETPESNSDSKDKEETPASNAKTSEEVPASNSKTSEEAPASRAVKQEGVPDAPTVAPTNVSPK